MTIRSERRQNNKLLLPRQIACSSPASFSHHSWKRNPKILEVLGLEEAVRSWLSPLQVVFIVLIFDPVLLLVPHFIFSLWMLCKTMIESMVNMAPRVVTSAKLGSHDIALVVLFKLAWYQVVEISGLLQICKLSIWFISGRYKWTLQHSLSRQIQ